MIESLAEVDKFSLDEMKWFWSNSQNIQQSSITGSETFPGEMMVSAFKNIIMSNSILDLLVEYYMAAYETLEFWKPFGEGHEDYIVISVKMNQFGRCRIGSEIFGSNMSSPHVSSNVILEKYNSFFLIRLICQMKMEN